MEMHGGGRSDYPDLVMDDDEAQLNVSIESVHRCLG